MLIQSFNKNRLIGLKVHEKIAAVTELKKEYTSYASVQVHQYKINKEVSEKENAMRRSKHYISYISGRWLVLLSIIRTSMILHVATLLALQHMHRIIMTTLSCSRLQMILDGSVLMCAMYGPLSPNRASGSAEEIGQPSFRYTCHSINHSLNTQLIRAIK